MFDDITSDWDHLASVTEDVFSRPRIAPQGQDGVAHLNYYDAERQLSFQWDGDYGQNVVVSHGGYGEPVKWTFNFVDIFRHYSSHGEQLNSVASSVYHFKKVCDKWIEMTEQKWNES